MFDVFVKKQGMKGYFLFRLIVGAMFFMHGAQKTFGWFGGTPASFGTMFGTAGLIEVFVGAFVILGIFSRLAGFIGAIEMLVAYFMVHFPNGWNPLTNGGELAVLYFGAFVLIMKEGSGRWYVESIWSKDEYF